MGPTACFRVPELDCGTRARSQPWSQPPPSRLGSRLPGWSSFAFQAAASTQTAASPTRPLYTATATHLAHATRPFTSLRRGRPRWYADPRRRLSTLRRDLILNASGPTTLRRGVRPLPRHADKTRLGFWLAASVPIRLSPLGTLAATTAQSRAAFDGPQPAAAKARRPRDARLVRRSSCPPVLVGVAE